MDDKLFYTYTGKWSSNVLPTTQLYPDSLILHENTKRIIHNGIIYGSGIEGDVYYIEGLSTNTAGTWTGTNVNITSYYEGLTIIYLPKVNAGTSTTTLNINNLGAKTCYINNVPITSEHYIPNVPILLTYSNNSWKRCDYSAHKDSYDLKVYNKDGQNTSYNIVFSDQSNNNTYTFAYVDAEFNYNPSTNTLNVGKINAILNSLVANGSESHISEINRKVITNIGITTNKQIAYQYANTIGVSYFSKGTYYGEIFNDYDNNVAYGTFGSSFGTYNVTYNKSEVAFCSYNAYNQTQIFSIGIGTSHTNRKNALWIDNIGSAYTSSIIPQGNKLYDLGTANNRFNTTYGNIFNGTRFTGTSDKVKVIANNNADVKYVVGYRDDTKDLYYENSLSFTDNGQLRVDVPNGTKPFVIASQTLVNNLNADLLDGKHASDFSTSNHTHTFVLGATTITTNGGTYNVINGPLSINTSADSTKAFSIRRTGDSEAVKHWVDDSTFHIDYTNDEISNQIAWRFINTDTESPHTPSQASDTTVYLNSSRQFYPNTNNTGSIGTSTSYWKDGYITTGHITNVITNSVSFNGTVDIGGNSRFIYWLNGVATASTANVGSDSKPVYLKNGVITQCANGLDVNVKTGTQYRLAYYSNTNEISSGNNIWTNGTKLAINSTSEPTQILYVNGTSYFTNTINIDSNSMGLANHINFNRAAFNCINVPSNGTFAVTINGASAGNKAKLAVDVNSVYPGQNNDIVDLGTSSYRWKTGYINNLITKKVTFYNGSTNINDIGTNTKFIYWLNGVATASTATVGNTGRPIYLNGGVFTPCNDAFIPKALVSKGTTATTTAGQVYGVVGNATSGSRVPTKWYVYLDTGETELKDGMIIEFRLPTAGLGTVGECITIDGNEQHFHQVVYNTNSFLTTHFAVNSVITVQYDATIAAPMYGKYDSSTSKYVHNGNTQTSTTGVWRVLSLYDSGNTDVRYEQTIYYPMKTVASDGAIRRYTLCMQTPDGKITSLCLTDNGAGSTTKTMYSGYLDPRKIYYWAHTDNYAANANITRNNTMLTHEGSLIDYRYTFNCGTTLTARSNLYLVGTINEHGFKLDPTTPWSCTLPTTEDGKVYIYIGMVYPDASCYRGTLEENNTIYIYKGGAIRTYSGYSEYSNYADRLKTARTITIGQTGRSFNGSANISWTIANIFGTTAIGTTNKPIYYNGATFVECTNVINASINAGTANRMAWYSGSNEISSASTIYANNTQLSINKTGVPANSGNFQVVGTSTMRNIYPEATNTYDLGSTSLKWKTGYINNLITTKVTFYDGTNNVNDIGTNTRFIYWLNGVPTASTATVGSTSEPVYLNNGVLTKCTNFYDYNLTTLTKSIKVMKTWVDTGISGTNLETGTYIIQMVVGTNIYYSGVVSWYKDSTSSTETDEIVLHMAGKNPTERIYLKTTMTSSGSLKLQISGEKDWSAAANIVFKFKKMI